MNARTTSRKWSWIQLNQRRAARTAMLLLLLMLILPAVVQAQFNYTTYNGAITITGYTGSGGAVTIPDTINSLPVTSIGDQAFYNCNSLTSVTIGTSVISIGNKAFWRCRSLTSVTIPDSVTSIGGGAFMACYSLTNVVIPASVTVLGSPVFLYCSGLAGISVDPLNSVYSSVDGVLFNKTQTTLLEYPGARTGPYTIPNSVTSIWDYAFSYCGSLTSVTIPSTVTYIGYDAFWTCLSLTSVTIPNGVIGNLAFDFCPSLTSVAIGKGVTSIAFDAFTVDCPSLTVITVDALNSVYSSVDGVMFNKNQTTLAQYPAAKAGSYTIPNNVSSLGDRAFYGCTQLTSVTIPNNVTNIGNEAFYRCTSLTSVTIPNSVTNIEEGAFDFCTGLTSVRIGTGVTRLGDSAFWNCTNLRDVGFQGNAPSLGYSVFPGDNNATVYYLPGTSGWTNPFGGRPAVMLNPPNAAGSLQVTITPAGAITAGARWYVDGGIPQPSGATVIGLSVGNHAVSFSTIIGWTRPSDQTAPIIANSTTPITGVYTAAPQAQCFNYTDNGDGTATITAYTCTNGVVTMPSTINGLSVTSIGDEAFFQNTNLTSVMIGTNVISIGGWAFYYCTNLTGVYFNGNAPSLGGSSVFAGSNHATVYYLPGITGWGTTFGGRPTVLWPLPTIQTPPQTQTAEAGLAVGLRVEASSSSPLFCLWYLNYTNLLSCSTNQELELTNVQFVQSGTYTVVVTNGAGAVTSAPAMLNVIAAVQRRPAEGVQVMGEAGGLLNVDYADSLSATPNWLPLDTVSLVNTSQYCFDVSEPLPPQRFYRAWQTGTPSVIPSLSLLGIAPAITLTGTIGHSVRLDYINQVGPTDAWVTLDTVTLTNTSQLYFDTSAPGQPQRLYRLLPMP
jgi:hypothetical protein